MSHLAITWAMTLQFTMAGNSKLFAASAAIKHKLTKQRHIMEDIFDNFEDDFDEGEFMDDDQFEGSLKDDIEMDEQRSDGSDCDDSPEDTESEKDDFTVKDAFIVGGAIGYSYEEGRSNRKRKKRINIDKLY